MFHNFWSRRSWGFYIYGKLHKTEYRWHRQFILMNVFWLKPGLLFSYVQHPWILDMRGLTVSHWSLSFQGGAVVVVVVVVGHSLWCTAQMDHFLGPLSPYIWVHIWLNYLCYKWVIYFTIVSTTGVQITYWHLNLIAHGSLTYSIYLYFKNRLGWITYDTAWVSSDIWYLVTVCCQALCNVYIQGVSKKIDIFWRNKGDCFRKMVTFTVCLFFIKSYLYGYYMWMLSPTYTAFSTLDLNWGWLYYTFPRT